MGIGWLIIQEALVHGLIQTPQILKMPGNVLAEDTIKYFNQNSSVNINM